MERISNTKRGMASLAVFRALYDGKKDINEYPQLP